MRPAPASFPPLIALDPASATPLYRQLFDWFRTAILTGRLKPGQRVPSSRQLAAELKLSRIPVLAAYEQLYAEGYLETFMGAGTCVARAIPDENLRPKDPGKAPEAKGRGARRIAKRAAAIAAPERPWLTNMGAFRVGLPAVERLPHSTWARLVNRHVRYPPKSMLAYGDAMGHLPFREAIAEYLSLFRAVRCEAAQILVTTGSQQGLQIAAQVLLDPGAKVWMEEPGYPGAQQALKVAGMQLVPVPVDEEGLDVAAGLRRGRDVRAAYITPSHQFPLGVTMSAARRLQLLNWATRQGAWIIEDDHDSEYRYGSRPIAALQGLDADARVIYVGTFSKVMFPALRLGYVVVPKDLVSHFAVARDATDTFSSTLQQAVMTDFIREGHFARHLRRMRALYQERRRVLVEAIRTELTGKLEVLGSEAGMQLAAWLPKGVDDVAVSRRAAARGVSVRPLSLCYLKRPARGGLILGYGGAELEEIRAGVRILKDCL